MDEEIERRKKALAKKRAERDEAVGRAQELQELEDREAIFELEEQYGKHQVAVLRLPYKEGRPVLYAVRCPSAPEMKRYRAMTQKLDKGRVDPKAATEAAEQLATATLVYPDAETYARVKEEAPLIHAHFGVAAANLGMAEADEQGKD